MYIKPTLLEFELAVVIHNALGEVKVTGIPVAIEVLQLSAKNRDIRTTLYGKVDVLSGLAEVPAVPVEVAYSAV